MRTPFLAWRNQGNTYNNILSSIHTRVIKKVCMYYNMYHTLASYYGHGVSTIEGKKLNTNSTLY